jgi:K+-sensing histidine kinase KdpD
MLNDFRFENQTSVTFHFHKQNIFTMFRFRLIVVLFVSLFASLTQASAQNAKQVEKATAMVNELNGKLVAVNPALALTDAQKAQCQTLYEKKILANQEVNKGEGDEATKKEKLRDCSKKCVKVIKKK